MTTTSIQHHRVPSVLLPFPVTIVICWLVSQAAASPTLQVHRRFAKEELQQVFHVDNHEDVPEYDVVRIRTLVKRDTSEGSSKHINLDAFGENIRLRLDRNSHLAESVKRLKVLVADVKDGKVNITEEETENATSEVGEPYHDVANMAAVTIHHDPVGNIRMEGTLGKSLVIKPAPLRVKEELQRIIATTADDEMFLDDEYPFKPLNSSWNNINDALPYGKKESSNDIHIVYKQKPERLQGGSDYLFMEPDLPPAPVRKWLRHKREAPETIWPEVLVIADYDTFNMHGANSVNIKRYFVSFWNGVDLRYKLLSGPRVRISLAGIIISKGRDATPYLENNRVKGDAVDSAAALTDMGKYLFRERRLPTYDLAVVVTKLDVCRRQPSGTCSKGTAGFAYVGGACVVNSRLEKVNSVAIVEDTGGFSGIIVAAHEVGHLLGAVHDGSPAPSYLGGPGAEHCRWEDGFIMSDLRHTERGFQWSTCSIDQFRHFLNSDTATCLHNVPHEDEELPRILPGKMLSLDAQCRKDRGTSACFKDDRVCAQLFCFDSKSGYCVSYRPAAEGSPCGDGQHCISGRCVAEHDNYIPDFTKISEVVVDKPETAATEVKPSFSKPDETSTTPKDKKQKLDITTTPRSTTARSKFRYNTVFRKLTTTPKSTFDSDFDDKHNITENNDRKNEAICDDVMQTLAGGLTCKQFLRNYRPRYCSHPYIILNCCASRKLMCNE